MNALKRVSQRRRGGDAAGRGGGVRRAVVLMPNGLTLFNLFCGVYAIILAIRGAFAAAPAFIVLGGVADTLDGRVARATGTGSRFGEELDSLVDALSFGFAPALIVYLELPNRGTWSWLFVFIFTACAVMRLARFNVEQAGRKKTHFHGLPSPAAGLTLASYYWFSQTPLYNQTVILFTDSKTLSDLPWHTILPGLMAVLAALMISDVPYPAVPSIGFSTIRKLIGTIVVAGCVVLLLVRREEFIFPAMIVYVLFGAVKWLIIGFLGRSGRPDEIFWEIEPNGGPARDQRRPAPPVVLGRPTAATPFALAEEATEAGRDESRVDTREPPAELRDERRPEDSTQPRRRRRRRGRGGNRPPTPGATPPGQPLPETPSPTGPAE
jgi:CDP-diacylglycerol--serine O-phosphatidyltransferase